MKILFTAKALKDYKNLTREVQNIVDKQLEALLRDIRYPSLRTKKYDESQNIWQARINKDLRLFFGIEKDVYVIIAICKHPK
ncbi:MAG: type II toxin-antitoxin system RelE/ParE family toxin [Candidatus Magnetoovum sp. WYHC-5]|nr:type II toxin-antitoxin system RelE/ParE family toxin [Candidatus Magnetoovum sp. WYHC-5]